LPLATTVLDVLEVLALERLAQVGHQQPVAADVDRAEQAT
jgi:hypothetical protein